MALSQKHRVALYEFLEPQLGDDVTEALLSEFPTDPGDELVTKQFLRAELAELRTELHTGLGDVQSGLRGEIADVQSGLRGEIAQLRVEMEQIHTKAMRTTLGAMGVMTAFITIFT
jgi:hypothetical protein